MNKLRDPIEVSPQRGPSMSKYAGRLKKLSKYYNEGLISENTFKLSLTREREEMEKEVKRVYIDCPLPTVLRDKLRDVASIFHVVVEDTIGWDNIDGSDELEPVDLEDHLGGAYGCKGWNVAPGFYDWNSQWIGRRYIV